MINLNQLRVFHEAAKNMNFTAAAKKLCITQPAVTAHMKLFENFSNLKLFQRRGRKIHLTDEGKALYDYARKIFEYEKEIEDLIDDLKELKRGTLRLGTSKTYARYFMPFLITSFRDAYPHIKIHLHEGSSSDIIHSLLDFKNELAVIAKVEDNPDVCLIPFTHEELALVPAFDHLRARKEALRFKELTKEMIIMHERVSETRRQAERSFAENRCTLKILMQKIHAETVKLLVQHGEVVALLVRKAVIHELQEGKLVTLPSQITRSS